jgi:hypothetical protein
MLNKIAEIKTIVSEEAEKIEIVPEILNEFTMNNRYCFESEFISWCQKETTFRSQEKIKNETKPTKTAC